MPSPSPPPSSSPPSLSHSFFHLELIDASHQQGLVKRLGDIKVVVLHRRLLALLGREAAVERVLHIQWAGRGEGDGESAGG